jgi:hypothetical protein
VSIEINSGESQLMSFRSSGTVWLRDQHPKRVRFPAAPLRLQLRAIFWPQRTPINITSTFVGFLYLPFLHACALGEKYLGLALTPGPGR